MARAAALLELELLLLLALPEVLVGVCWLGRGSAFTLSP